MWSFPNARRSLFWALACQVATPSAYADPTTCPALTLALEPALRARHPALEGSVRAAFATRADVDPCARVDIDLTDDDIRVEVKLADGRVAERRVQRPDDVVPMLEALLVVPKASAVSNAPEPFEAEEPSPSVPELPRPRAVARPELALTRFERATPERANELPTNRTGVELALVAGAGVGDHQSSMSLGVLGLVGFSDWLAGVQARAREYRADAPTRPANAWATFELAALGGRRLRFRSMELDLVAGPAAAFDAGSVSETGPAPPEREPPAEPGVVPRFVAASHLVFAPRSFLHGFVGLEGEVGGTGKSATNDAYELPVWMVGFTVGAAVGSR